MSARALGMAMATDLDPVDRNIVRILRRSARMPISLLAKEVGRSRTAVQARIERLEKAGVIRGYSVILGDASDHVGAFITVYLHERLAPDPVLERLRAMPEVLGCYRVTGDADLVVTMKALPLDELRQACGRIWSIPEIRSTDTSLVFDTFITPPGITP